jgi:hypothetical protein
MGYMAASYSTAGGCSVEVVRLTCTKHDGEWIRVRHHEFFVEGSGIAAQQRIGPTHQRPPLIAGAYEASWSLNAFSSAASSITATIMPG